MEKNMKLIDILFPQGIKCLLCGREENENPICLDCYNNLPIIKDHVCAICGGKVLGVGEVCFDCMNYPNSYKKCFTLLEYKDEYKHLILSYKNGNKRYLVKLLSYLLLDKFKTIDIPFDVIIPVPCSKERLKERGFNHIEEMVEDIACYSGKVDNTVLSRIRYTPHQTGLGREFREENLKGAFKVIDKKKIKNKTVLLVDDIYTTGATINECAKVLYSEGAGVVYGLTLARAVTSMDTTIN